MKRFLIVFIVLLLFIPITSFAMLEPGDPDPGCQTNSDCSAGSICHDGQCMTCNSDSHCTGCNVCVNGGTTNAYCTGDDGNCPNCEYCTFGSCSLEGNECSSDNDCSNGYCDTNSCSCCTYRVSDGCSGGNLYYYDSCGRKGDLKENCSTHDGTYCRWSRVVEDREYYCSGSSCDNYELVGEEYCNNYDGYYCSGDQREYRSYYCSGSDGSAHCNNYNPTPDTNCGDIDRGFCVGPSSQTTNANGHCQSYPEVTSSDWNYKDHNYEYSRHEYDGYKYCGGGNSPPDVVLYWEYSSNTNDSYRESEIQLVEKGDSFEDSNLIVDRSPGSVESYTVPGYKLEFNTEYEWRVRVEDENGNWSNHGGYDWNYDEFSTDYNRHEPDFSYTPPSPHAEERVRFKNKTDFERYYFEKEEVWWKFENADPDQSNQDSPSTEFLEQGVWEVRLRVMDNDEVWCEEVKNIEVDTELPDWEETDPFGFFDLINFIFARF